jgi:hypothetical protein
MGISLVRAGNTWRIRDLDALPDDRARQRFEDEFHRAFPEAVSETVALKFKPIPPSASERMAAYRDHVAAFLGENAGKPVDEETKQRFSKEANARRQELEHLLQGTIAEPLMNQKQKIEAEMRVAAQAKDRGRVSELTSQLSAVEVRLDEVVRGTTQTSAPAAAVPDATFGPVIERVVNNSGGLAGFHGLDFESGQLWTATATALPSDDLRKQWIADHGIDLLVLSKGGFKWRLVGPEFKVARLAQGRWDQATPGELRRALDAAVMETEDGWPFHAIHDRLEQPLDFAFQTGGGTIGLLQLTGFTDNPSGVKLRYKLVQTE